LVRHPPRQIQPALEPRTGRHARKKPTGEQPLKLPETASYCQFHVTETLPGGRAGIYSAAAGRGAVSWFLGRCTSASLAMVR
jgi:hypothetical protein